MAPVFATGSKTLCTLLVEWCSPPQLLCGRLSKLLVLKRSMGGVGGQSGYNQELYQEGVERVVKAETKQRTLLKEGTRHALDSSSNFHEPLV